MVYRSGGATAALARPDQEPVVLNFPRPASRASSCDEYCRHYNHARGHPDGVPRCGDARNSRRPNTYGMEDHLCSADLLRGRFFRRPRRSQVFCQRGTGLIGPSRIGRPESASVSSPPYASFGWGRPLTRRDSPLQSGAATPVRSFRGRKVATTRGYGETLDSLGRIDLAASHYRHRDRALQSVDIGPPSGLPSGARTCCLHAMGGKRPRASGPVRRCRGRAAARSSDASCWTIDRGLVSSRPPLRPHPHRLERRASKSSKAGHTGMPSRTYREATNPAYCPL